MMTSTTGCIICGGPVEFPEFTLECTACYEANLDYANKVVHAVAETHANKVVHIEVIPPAFSWESQACQYAEHGPPGLNHEQHAVNADAEEIAVGDPDTVMLVDCLLMRDAHGALVGILNHYTGENEYEKTGNVNVWVRPDRQRRGIATALLREAFARWQVDWRTQRYTEEGLYILKKLLTIAGGNKP